MYAQYKSHDDKTLSYMEDTMLRFHFFKTCFLTQASQQKIEGQSKSPENGTLEQEKGRQGNICQNLDAIQEVV